MKVFAYCTRPARFAVAMATQSDPMVSPPMVAAGFESRLMIGAALIYIRLHGSKSKPAQWFGEDDDGRLWLALRADQLAGVRFERQPVVVIANCYGDKSAISQAFYNAGATAVIAGSGENYAAGRRVIGTDKLVQGIIDGLRQGMTPAGALNMAKRQLWLTAWRKPDRDALGFNILEKTNHE